MRKIFASLVIGGLLAGGFASTATADVLVVPINVSWGASPGTGGATVGFDFVVDVASINSVTIDITHTWQGDISFTLTAPGGAVFDLATILGGSADLGIVGNGLPGDEAPYTFVEVSGNGTGWGPLGGGTTQAELWQSGPFAAAGWSVSIQDPIGGDGGSVTNVTIDYTAVPAPGALALLGLAGLAGRRRRRRA